MPPPHPTRLLVTLAALVVSVALAGCEGDKKQLGARCSRDAQCEQGLCVAGVDGEQSVCTRSCAKGDDCPEGWSCSAVTESQVLVCSHRPATPFGGAARGGSRPSPD